MGCACSKKNSQSSQEGVVISPVNNSENNNFKGNIALEPVTAPVQNTVITNTVDQGTAVRVAKAPEGEPVRARVPANLGSVPIVVTEAMANNLKSCYLCAKKHIVRAQIFFEEYHTGYPDHIKNLMESLRISEVTVRKAFLLWQKIMGHLDMAANELLGNDINAETMNVEHVALANEIRDARIRLSNDPLASIDFDELAVKVHTLQHKSLDK